MVLGYHGPHCALSARYPLDTTASRPAPARPGSLRTPRPGRSERGPGFLHELTTIAHHPAEVVWPDGISAPAPATGTPVWPSTLRLGPLAVAWCICPPATPAANVYRLERVLAGSC